MATSISRMAGASFYDILGVAPTSTTEQIKKAYQRAALALHPDRHYQQASSPLPPPPSSSGTSELGQLLPEDQEGQAYGNPPPSTTSTHHNKDFLQIQAAWEVLRDPVARKDYDLRQQAGASVVVWDEIDIIDMNLDDDQGVYTYPCRCGEDYQVGEQDVGDQAAGTVLMEGCPGCSLYLKIRVPG